jgi:NADPH:quinone reductase-like Zn-dependent oxidoreductase
LGRWASAVPWPSREETGSPQLGQPAAILEQRTPRPGEGSNTIRERRDQRLLRELDATPIDYKREDFTRVLPNGFDVVFDGIGEDGFHRSFTALNRGGVLCAYGYRASVQAQSSLRSILMLLMRVYVWKRLLSWLPGGKRPHMYSINLMRALHPAWFREDLERLFGLLATRAICPRVTERISFDEVANAHRRLEEGGLEGKLVLCPDLGSPPDRAPPRCQALIASNDAPLPS